MQKREILIQEWAIFRARTFVAIKFFVFSSVQNRQWRIIFYERWRSERLWIGFRFFWWWRKVLVKINYSGLIGFWLQLINLKCFLFVLLSKIIETRSKTNHKSIKLRKFELFPLRLVAVMKDTNERVGDICYPNYDY